MLDLNIFFYSLYFFILHLSMIWVSPWISSQLYLAWISVSIQITSKVTSSIWVHPIHIPLPYTNSRIRWYFHTNWQACCSVKCFGWHIPYSCAHWICSWEYLKYSQSSIYLYCLRIRVTSRGWKSFCDSKGLGCLHSTLIYEGLCSYPLSSF
jgi:hypothetical protein